MAYDEQGVRVAVVGAGIAGLTAALELAKRGYQVTVYEESDTIGGNLSSREHKLEGGGSVFHDVYPHMFPSWYANFWRMFEQDLGLSREGNFEQRKGAKVLRKGEREYIELENPTNLRTAWGNLTSGFLPLPDMFIYGYSMIDLSAQSFEPDELLSRYSLNGFLHSRGYATERAAEMLDLAVMEIWSIHGGLTSAAAYKDFVRRAFAIGTTLPFAWVLKGSLWEKLILPIVRKLDHHGCDVRTRHRVETVSIEGARVGLEVRDLDAPLDSGSRTIDADYVVLAVNPKGLTHLVHAGKEGFRIVDRLPALSQVGRLRAEPIPVVDLYFKHKLPDIPHEHVGLTGSEMNLSFFQLSGLWEDDPNMHDRTAVVLAASDFYGLPAGKGSDGEQTEAERNADGYRMIQAFHDYLPIFRPGAHWDDPSSDIDWELSSYQSNTSNLLFINQVGSGKASPRVAYHALPNVFFAGDYVHNSVAMATIEGAVLSGLEAARELWTRRPIGPAIEILEDEARDQRWLLATKLLFSANAYWAKWFSTALDAMGPVSRGDFSVVPRTVATMLSLPYYWGGELMTTGYALWENLFVPEKRRKRRSGDR
jgi:protoporphyrinogen oxidase